jgi:homoserine O-acetyltransferase
MTEIIILKNTIPNKGLAVARMAAHITYLSKKGLQEKFGRKLQEREDLKFGFDADFQNRELFKVSRICFR